MKRALVSYSSDSEEEIKETNTKRMKLLPKLSSTLVVEPPKDDPSLHQGRVRTTPFVDGHFATHVYVSIDLEQNPRLKSFLEEVLAEVDKTESNVFRLFNTENDANPVASNSGELHLSVSRPLYLREHQRDNLRKRMRQLATESSRFNASFASFSILDNDEKTRSFLTLEIGAGHEELNTLSTALNPLLRELRQPSYYIQARYHASIGWILTTEEAGPRFSKQLVQRLDLLYGERLRALILEAEEVHVKIGKQVSKYQLGAP
ncbi:poly(U)-specific 3'-to-5' RNA exonuclease [Serendipita sp. 400]|nr:poly(U)-specific 3'-to-5' RNA exonuclease [Serendipita sp. 400]